MSRIAVSPIGTYHCESVCAYCAVRGVIQPDAGYHAHEFGQPCNSRCVPLLKRTVMQYTRAIAHVCVNTTACERRRYRRENP